jgi:hypothetical protein
MTGWKGYDKVVVYDRMVPLKLARLQNLSFVKKCRKIIKKKERKMLFANISDFCLKIAFEKA